jgi:hypothetical protein
MEAILEQAAEQRFILRQCDQAIADIARRQNAIFAAQPARAAAIVGDGDDGRKVGDGKASEVMAPPSHVLLQAAQQRGKARASTDGHDPYAEFAQMLCVHHIVRQGSNRGKPARLRPGAFALRIEKLGEARIFLKEGEILVVARVIAILRTQLNRDF